MAVNQITRLAMTTGEPAGIGPDLLVTIAQRDHQSQLVAVGDPDLLTARAAAMDLPLQVRLFSGQEKRTPSRAGELWVDPIKPSKFISP